MNMKQVSRNVVGYTMIMHGQINTYSTQQKEISNTFDQFNPSSWDNNYYPTQSTWQYQSESYYNPQQYSDYPSNQPPLPTYGKKKNISFFFLLKILFLDPPPLPTYPETSTYPPNQFYSNSYSY